MKEEPICIRRTATVEEADIIVAWLDDQGVEAAIVDRENPGVLAFGVTDAEGIAICVADQATAERARTLLAEHDRDKAKATVLDPAGGAIELKCEECGCSVSFPAGTRGEVQECPECGAYLDVASGDTDGPHSAD